MHYRMMGKALLPIVAAPRLRVGAEQLRRNARLPASARLRKSACLQAFLLFRLPSRTILRFPSIGACRRSLARTLLRRLMWWWVCAP